MQPRKREIEEAWKVHDRRPDEFKCQDEDDWQKKKGYCDSCIQVVKINWIEGIPHCTNSKCKKRMQIVNMGHSHFNKVCQRMVKKYAAEHPIPRQRTEKPKVVKMDCVRCNKKRPIGKLLHVPQEDQSKAKDDEILMEYICPKCHRRRENRKRVMEEKKIKEVALMEKFEREAPLRCLLESPSFGNYDLENTTCSQKCDPEVKELCIQKTKKEKGGLLPSSQRQSPKS